MPGSSSLLVFQTPSTGSEHRQPESEKRCHACQHDDRTACVVVECPGADRVKHTPDNERSHDPLEDPFGARR